MCMYYMYIWSLSRLSVDVYIQGLLSGSMLPVMGRNNIDITTHQHPLLMAFQKPGLLVIVK